MIAQQKYKDARELTMKQMMQNEESIDIDYGQGRQGIHQQPSRLMNDTYADYEDSPGKVSQTREEYDSEDEKHNSPEKRKGSYQQAKSGKKTMAMKLFNGMSKKMSKLL